MSAGVVLEVVVYCLLVLFWLGVLFFALAYFVLAAPQPVPKHFRRVRFFFLAVATLFSIDSAYWAVVNISHTGLIATNIEPLLRYPWAVAIVKSLVLVSSVVFWLILMHSREGIQESYLWKFVNYTWDAIGILDANGHMRFWNDGSVRLFHFLPGDVVGRHIKDFMVPKDLHEEIDLALGEIKATKQAKRNMRTARLTAEGKRIPVDITISPIVDKGQFQGYFGIMRAALPTSICDLKRFRNFGDASGSPVVPRGSPQNRPVGVTSKPASS